MTQLDLFDFDFTSVTPEPAPKATVTTKVVPEDKIQDDSHTRFVFEIPETSDSEVKETVETTLRDYTVFIQNHIAYQVIDGIGKLIRDSKGNILSEKERLKIVSYVEVRDALDELIEMQLNPLATDDVIESCRAVLNLRYDNHVYKFGVISNKIVHRLVVDDPEYLKVAAIENIKTIIEVNSSGVKTSRKVYEKGDIFSIRTQFPWTEPTTATNAVEAGLISYAYRHEINLEYIASMIGKNVDETKAELLSNGEYFINPEEDERIELKSEYLSGNIKRKIEGAAHLPANVKALEEVLPKPLTIEDIDFSLGSFWIPSDLVEKWIAKDLSANVKVTYDSVQDKWEVMADYQARQLVTDYNVEELNAFDIISITLNLKEPVIRRKIVESDGTERYVVNQEATLTARQFKNELCNKFHDFIMDDHESVRTIETIYNNTFNNHVVRQYTLPKFDVYPNAVSIVNGKKFILREHQKRAVTRCIEGNTLLAHCVGAGKTAVLITAAMELKRLKLATKSLLIVQNATLQQYAEFAPKLYPNGKVLIATKNDLIKEKRKRFMGRIATGDWDLIVMAQSSFDMIENNPDTVRTHFENQIYELEKILNEKRSRPKDLERQLRSLKLRLKQLGDKQVSEDIVYFEELGIDALFVDEAHAYKRNFFVTKKESVKGLDRGASQKAFSLTLKINHIREKTGGRNIYFATGTPVTNTIAELWNMVRYVSPETLADYGVDTFDRFASTFTETETALEIDAAGRFKMVTRFAKYTNIIELSKMFQATSDVILSEDLKDIPRPPVKNGRPEQITIPRSTNITKFMGYLADLYAWFENLGSEKKDYTHIPLLIYGLSRKATIDLRLIDSSAQDDATSKVNVCVMNAVQKYKEYDSVKGAQVIFCDLYQNSNGKRVFFNVYEELKRKLIANGIPAQEIAIINDYSTDKQKQNVFDQVNKGEIRIIIGSTGKLGTGVNIQERLAVAHHIDAPFRPSDMEQRNGRIIRQGNMIAEVEILMYGVEQTLDAGMYQILERKQKFINDAMKGKNARNSKEINDTALDYATFSALISGNEQIKRKVSVETRLRELHALEYQFRRTIRRNAGLKETLLVSIPVVEQNILDLKGLVAKHESFDAENFSLEINGKIIAGDRAGKISALHSHITQKTYAAISHARITKNAALIDAGIIKINDIMITLSGFCDTLYYGGADERSACVKYRLANYTFHNKNIKTGADVMSGSGLVTSVKHLLECKTEELSNELKNLEFAKERLAQLEATVGHEVFKHADERNALQKEYEQLLFDLNKANLLQDKKTFETMPCISDYIDLSAEITDKIEVEEEHDSAEERVA